MRLPLVLIALLLTGCTQMAALPPQSVVQEAGGVVPFKHYAVTVPDSPDWLIKFMEPEAEHLGLVRPDPKKVEVRRMSQDGQEVGLALTRRGGSGPADERSLMDAHLGLYLAARVEDIAGAEEATLEQYILGRVREYEAERFLRQGQRYQFFTATQDDGSLSFAFTDLVVEDKAFPQMRLAALVVKSEGAHWIVGAELLEREPVESQRDFLTQLLLSVRGR